MNEYKEPLASAKGLLVGTLISIPLWYGICRLVLWVVMR